MLRVFSTSLVFAATSALLALGCGSAPRGAGGSLVDRGDLVFIAGDDWPAAQTPDRLGVYRTSAAEGTAMELLAGAAGPRLADLAAELAGPVNWVLMLPAGESMLPQDSAWEGVAVLSQGGLGAIAGIAGGDSPSGVQWLIVMEEGAALMARGPRVRSLAQGEVVVLDLRRVSANRRRGTVMGIRASLLSEGDVFDLAEGRLVFAEGKTQHVSRLAPRVPMARTLPAAIRILADAGEASVEIATDGQPSGQAAAGTLRADSATQRYRSLGESSVGPTGPFALWNAELELRIIPAESQGSGQ